MRPNADTISIERVRHDREARQYRDALRSVGDIARRAIRGEGETRMNALLAIDRVTATALRENA